MATDYQYANYQSQLGDSAYNEFKHLERQFANAFGSSGPGASSRRRATQQLRTDRAG
jgi:hypothetical protein